MTVRAHQDERALVKSLNPIVDNIDHTTWYFPGSGNTHEFAGVGWTRAESKEDECSTKTIERGAASSHPRVWSATSWPSRGNELPIVDGRHTTVWNDYRRGLIGVTEADIFRENVPS
jgi:hypothetical protein